MNIISAIWNHLEIWLYNQYEIKLNLTVCEVLLDLPFAISEYIELASFVLILSKWSINFKKNESKPLFFIELLKSIQVKVKTVDHDK